MVNRPYSGRIMVVGLGKRTDRPAQSPETEQFWAMSTTDVTPNKWIDVVLPIKGNGGINIHSLVVVPDCESPHNYTNDAICYIDNIEISDNPTPRFTYGYYTINFDKRQQYTRSDRRINGIAFTSPSDGKQSVITSKTPNTAYVNLGECCFKARAGEQVTAAFDYIGGWMNGYVFIDKNNDGKTDTNSKKKNIFAYIDGLDVSDIEKKILRKMSYPSEKTYNREIAQYIISLDLTREEKISALESLNFKVDDKGYISW